MTRSIPPSLSSVVEQLELEDARLVTIGHLDAILREAGVGTAARTVAGRLRERGWLLETGKRGVWEFAPGAVAGPYSRTGPTRPLQAALLKWGDVRCALTFQAAAWAMGAADRVPSRLEVAAASPKDAGRLPSNLLVSVFAPNLTPNTLKGVPVLREASVLVHMAASPKHVRSWASVVEWLPELAYDADPREVEAELVDRPATVAARLAYLMQGLRPDIAKRIPAPSSKTWFGPRGHLLRHDSRWQIADTMLPFDPRTLRPS